MWSIMYLWHPFKRKLNQFFGLYCQIYLFMLEYILGNPTQVPLWPKWNTLFYIHRTFYKSSKYIGLPKSQLALLSVTFGGHFFRNYNVSHTLQWRHKHVISSPLIDNSTVSAIASSGCQPKNIKALHYWPFVRGICRWPVVSPQRTTTTGDRWTQWWPILIARFMGPSGADRTQVGPMWAPNFVIWV